METMSITPEDKKILYNTMKRELASVPMARMFLSPGMIRKMLAKIPPQADN